LKLLGLIAEDQSDVDVLQELARKLARRQFGVRKFLGYGCGRIQAKARAWADQLHRQGCSLLMVVSDLDTRDLGDLSASLGTAVESCQIQSRVIIIPVREIEAWLLADHEAITHALRLRQPIKRQPNPEAVQNPKERLRDLVKERSRGRLTYLNTVHNGRIAKHIQVANLRRCRSFHSFEQFIRAHLG
jgi:hypothetical protein